MKETALCQTHINLGAKMAEFAGYNMPIVYSSIKEEHQTVRQSVGMFDVSHMGEFILKGDGASDLIQKVTSNDVERLAPGKAQYSCFPNVEGGIVDDLLVYFLEDGNFMLVVNASNIQKDWDWISKHNNENVEIHDITDKTTLLAIQGPKATEALQPLTEIDLSAIPYYTFTKGVFAGMENVLISATGYTGAGGFEIYFEKGNSQHIWDSIMSSGASFGIKPIGLAARDTLRLEMGYALYGNDINDHTNPYAAGLGWITKPKTGFNGSEKIVSQKEVGLPRRLVGFEMIDRGIPRHGYSIVDNSGTGIGEVTSGTQSPSLDKAIGMGYVDVAFKEPGTNIFINVRNKNLKATVVKPPFV